MIKSRLEGLANEIRQARHRRTRKIWAIIFDRALRILGPYLADKNVIYLLNRSELEAGSITSPSGFRIQGISATDDIPKNFWLALEVAQPNTKREEFIVPFAEHSRLWIGNLGEVPVCYAWSIRACNLKQWYVPLRPDDHVIFAVVTWPGARGVG